MSQVIIENLTINRPFAEPTQHFRFDDDGITSEIHDSRRASEYFIPIARPKKKNAQHMLDQSWIEEWREENRMVNDVRVADGQVTVEIQGVDVYDPTTGQIRSSSTDEIACWFLDTDYNGECFFVRHAYFLGADDPYGKLKRALRAEIDEALWSSLYSETSQPFDPPKSGKIAVKVINHYGDEVLKVFRV